MKRIILILFTLSLVCRAQIATPILGASSGVSTPALSFVSDTSNNCSATPCAVTVSPTAGNHVIIWTTSQTAAATAMADNASGGSTTYTDTGSALSAGGVFPRVWYSCNVKSGATTVTGTYGTTGADITIHVLQYSGGVSSSCLDAVAATLNTGVTQTAQTTSAITPVAGKGEVILGLFWQSTNDTTTFATSGSYTLRGNRADIFGNMLSGVTDQIVSSTTGSYTAAASTSTGVNYGGLAVSFQ